MDECISIPTLYAGERLNASSVRVEDADVVVVVIFHDDIPAVKSTLRDPSIGLRFSAIISPRANTSRRALFLQGVDRSKSEETTNGEATHGGAALRGQSIDDHVTHAMES
jgi:hypothetical protein